MPRSQDLVISVLCTLVHARGYLTTLRVNIVPSYS